MPQCLPKRVVQSVFSLAEWEDFTFYLVMDDPNFFTPLVLLDIVVFEDVEQDQVVLVQGLFACPS